MTTTHDLPTVAGWWRGADLELRRGIGTVDESEIAQRPAERTALWQAFTDAGVANGTPPPADDTDPVVDAAVEFVAQAPGPLGDRPARRHHGRRRAAQPAGHDRPASQLAPPLPPSGG